MSLPAEDLTPDDDDGGRTTARPRLGWHPVDPVSLVVGLLTVGVALLALLAVDVDVDAGVVLPVLLLVAGAAGLVTAARRTRT